VAGDAKKVDFIFKKGTISHFWTYLGPACPVTLPDFVDFGPLWRHWRVIDELHTYLQRGGSIQGDILSFTLSFSQREPPAMVSVDFVQAQSFTPCHAISTQFEVCFFHYHYCGHRSRPFFLPFPIRRFFITMLGNVRLQVHFDREIDHVPRTPCFPNHCNCRVHYIQEGIFTKYDLQGIRVHALQVFLPFFDYKIQSTPS